MNQSFDPCKSLQELEQDDWGEPPLGTHLVTTCHRLRRKPLINFGIEDLRIMLGQEIGVSFLMPFAIERLEQNPLAEGDYYPGDLLSAVLGVSKEFWNRNPDAVRRMLIVIQQARQMLTLSNGDLDDSMHLKLEQWQNTFDNV